MAIVFLAYFWYVTAFQWSIVPLFMANTVVFYIEKKVSLKYAGFSVLTQAGLVLVAGLILEIKNSLAKYGFTEYKDSESFRYNVIMISSVIIIYLFLSFMTGGKKKITRKSVAGYVVAIGINVAILCTESIWFGWNIIA